MADDADKAETAAPPVVDRAAEMAAKIAAQSAKAEAERKAAEEEKRFKESIAHLSGGYRVIVKKKPWGKGELMHFHGTEYKRDWAEYPQVPELFYDDCGRPGVKQDWLTHWKSMPGPDGYPNGTAKVGTWDKKPVFRKGVGPSGAKGGPALNHVDLGSWTNILESSDKARNEWARRWGDGQVPPPGANWGSPLLPGSAQMGTTRTRVLQSARGSLHTAHAFPSGSAVKGAGAHPEWVQQCGGGTFLRRAGARSLSSMTPVRSHHVGYRIEEDGVAQAHDLTLSKEGVWLSKPSTQAPTDPDDTRREAHRKSAMETAEVQMLNSGFSANDPKRKKPSYQQLREKEMSHAAKALMASSAKVDASLRPQSSAAHPSLYHFLHEGTAPPQRLPPASTQTHPAAGSSSARDCPHPHSRQAKLELAKKHIARAAAGAEKKRAASRQSGDTSRTEGLSHRVDDLVTAVRRSSLATPLPSRSASQAGWVDWAGTTVRTALAADTDKPPVHSNIIVPGQKPRTSHQSDAKHTRSATACSLRSTSSQQGRLPAPRHTLSSRASSSQQRGVANSGRDKAKQHSPDLRPSPSFHRKSNSGLDLITPGLPARPY